MKIHSSFSWWATKGFGIKLGSVTSPQPWFHVTAVGVCHGLGRDHYNWEDRTPHLPDNVTRTSLSLLLCPMPVGMGMHSTFKTTIQEPIVHVTSNITCSFAQSWLSHGQWSRQTCLLLSICRTSSRVVSRDGLTSHRHQWACWCAPGGIALDPSSNHWMAHQDHKTLSRVPGSEWRPNPPFRLLRYWYTDLY